MATVNQQIDALLKRRGNPAKKTASQRPWCIVARYSVGRYAEGQIISRHSSLPAAEKARLKNDLKSFTEIVEKYPSKRSVVLVAAKNPRAARNLFAVKLNAGNDRNGNSRRGYLVHEIIDYADVRHLGFVTEDGIGIKALTMAYGDVPTTGEFDISAKQYADLKRQGPVWLNVGAYLL